MTRQIVAKLATEIIQKSSAFYNECTQQSTGTKFPINFEMTKLGRMVVVELYVQPQWFFKQFFRNSK